MIAKAAFIGRITRDTELKYTNSGFPIARASIAANVREKEGEKYVDKPHYFDLKLLGKKAEALGQYLTKGKLVYVECDIRQNIWLGSDGKKNYSIDFLVNDLEFLSSDGMKQQSSRSVEKPAARSEDQGDFEDDLPF